MLNEEIQDLKRNSKKTLNEYRNSTYLLKHYSNADGFLLGCRKCKSNAKSRRRDWQGGNAAGVRALCNLSVFTADRSGERGLAPRCAEHPSAGPGARPLSRHRRFSCCSLLAPTGRLMDRRC